MGRPMPKSRDRWVTIPHLARSRPVKAQGVGSTTAIQIFYDGDEASATAGVLIEDLYDDAPIPTGILDPEGHEIYRIAHRDTVPIGFHYTADQYDEYGNFIGDDVEYYYDEEHVVGVEEDDDEE